MPLGTLDRTPPPFFKQGPSALSRLMVFSALALFLMVADARFRITQPLRAAIGTVLYPVQWLAMRPVELARGGGDYLVALEQAQASEAQARARLALQAQRAQQVELLTMENDRLRKLLATGVLTRLGPLYQIERAGGAYLLAALEVPGERFDAVAAQVNAHLQVAHNYRRGHRLNMWFVVAAESQGAVATCLRAIEAETGLPVHAFPKEREFRVELRLPATLPPHQEDAP